MTAFDYFALGMAWLAITLLSLRLSHAWRIIDELDLRLMRLERICDAKWNTKP